ncbi:MAG: hypothetical protein HC895_26330 [Leptolyngbyaceae cyanobacterium SM1_3_5]|nr:hypothetical protein [Leptolyngbyaceae cyanobacterium SM1_3_5]
MNTNGKVRIYDLSRELNLDNRDILTVCNQLNISVKSHSSTITEAEAAQIRSAAEKYNGSNGNSSSHKQNSLAHHPSSQVKKPTVQPPVKNNKSSKFVVSSLPNLRSGLIPTCASSLPPNRQRQRQTAP